MTKHRPSPSKAERREQQFEKLLAAMGMGEDDPFARFSLTQALEQIERDYTRRVAASGKQPDRKLVRRYRAAITKVLTLSKTIGPDFFGNEIEQASLSRLNPDLDDSKLRDLMEEHRHQRDDVAAALTTRGLDIDHWFKTSGDTYRKRAVRKLVVEPFLRLIAEHEITTSRKQLPRKRMFDALFDWLGVERKFRPSSASIDAIARDPAASASKSNAKRRIKS
jgi:hypothetical protein